MVSIPGSDFLTTILNVVSQSLLLPVMILLIIFILLILIEIGSIIAEFSSRMHLSEDEVDYLVNSIDKSTSNDEIIKYIEDSTISKEYKPVLLKIANTYHLAKDTRIAYVRKLLENVEFKMDKSLRKVDIISKVSSGCGLLGTLIPLGPGLASLGTGDVVTLSSQLIIAFNTTTIGLSASLVAFAISKIKRSWYKEDLSVLYVISEAIVGVEL